MKGNADGGGEQDKGHGLPGRLPELEGIGGQADAESAGPLAQDRPSRLKLVLVGLTTDASVAAPASSAPDERSHEFGALCASNRYRHAAS